ncbi:MAG: Metal-dependent hydrolase YbeY, involved in rRNA and/or ribosome maturation and assembly [Cytophagales bacterium]|jgi:rRNA maturation RNase YbeY|nr:rRNA maturation RNase YbeY [Bacteroidota bacterium]MBS1979954.1 rRNA maturation RNase YbeY [Bacteroidota bacterium]WHZ07300.1 MAG: Metal-dependent hydrolase YbeY, involved in rRNA and/or ribosome maturation and assembly [Cytophagales bacterium]
MPIRFFSEGVDFKLINQRKRIQWINSATRHEGKSVFEINFIFTSDKLLLRLNSEYLNHQTLTDIITFDYSHEKSISGDIHISIDRVKENSIKFGCTFQEELDRVMIHGVLHLCGYKDKSKSAKQQMRKKEDAYLSLR